MKDNLLHQFKDNEEEYLQWLDDHPDGFVLNTPRGISESYLVLHKSTCSTISEYRAGAKKGAFTERQYIKICSDNRELINAWVKKLGMSPSAITQNCSCWQEDRW